jgi:hypothetical protein
MKRRRDVIKQFLRFGVDAMSVVGCYQNGR